MDQEKVIFGLTTTIKRERERDDLKALRTNERKHSYSYRDFDPRIYSFPCKCANHGTI